MEMHLALKIFFLASLLQISLTFTCSDLSENQCNQLQKDGCLWSGTLCSGLYSPSCVPPSCYYIDSNYQGTETPDGTPGKPLKTLSDGFTKISGKNGFLIIINKLENATVAITKSSTISSNITIKPLFEDGQCTIDFTQYTSLFMYYLTVKGSLKLERMNLGLQFAGNGSASIFTVSSGAGLYFQNVEVHNTSMSQYLISLVRLTNSTFSMVNCKFSDATVIFQSFDSSTIIWENVHTSGQNYMSTSLSLIKKMTVKDCSFTGSLSGPFITATSGEEVILKNCTFKELDYSPQFTVYNGVKLTVEDCIFDRISNMGLKIFSFEQVRGLYGVQSVIKNSSFTNIVVITSLFYLDSKIANLSLVNVTMKNITHQTDTSRYTQGERPILLRAPRGVCCSSVRSAQLSVESSTFSDIGAHCFGLRDTTFTIKSSIFDNSQLVSSEAEIKREDVSILDERSGISWITIEGTTSLSQGTYKALIQDNKFIKNGRMPISGGAIRFTGMLPSEITITGNEFIGNKAYRGGAISSENALVSILKLENNIFVENYAYHGGAIYKNDTRSYETLTGVSVSIKDSQFIGNKAVKNGGALYLSWDSLWISDTEFISNSAVNGGALYFINLEDEAGMRSVSFIENYASNAGGAMKLFFKYSQLETNEMIFENNFDSNKQAINQGRPSYYLLSFYDLKMMGELANSGSLEDLVKNPELTKLNLTVNTSDSTTKLAEMKHKSGNELAQILHVQVFDSENNVAAYIDNEEITIKMVEFQNNISNYSASLVSSPVKFTISNGQFFAKSAIKMHGEPKTTATLRFSNVQGSSDFLQDSGLNLPSDWQVRFVDCEEGDIYDSHTKSCLTCAVGSFSFENPYKANHCNQCPEEIDCYGGDQVGPKSGYWMGNPKSLMAMKCPSPSACMGGYVDYEYFPNGKCQFPHQGNLCNKCAPKFAKFGSSAKCEDCQHTVEYYLKFGLFLLLQVTIILGLFKLNEKQDENNTFYVNIMKILISFIQINSIIASYNLNWSPLTKNFIHVINTFIPVNHDGFSIDCFISLALPDNESLIYVKVIVTFFQPFIIWGLAILAYALILSCSSQREAIGKKLKESLSRLFIISAFLVQPNLILTCLELFSCQNLGSAYFLKENSDLRCWTGSHLIWSYGVALPLLLIWAVLLPVILFLKTRKYSKFPCWQPFFYQGLEKKRFYWEFVMLFTKTLVIILFTVLTIIKAEIQILGTFFVCISLTVLFLRLRPYTDPRLHGLGFFSLVTLTLVSYIGFFSFTDNWMDIQMTIGSVLLVVANCGLFTLPAFYIIKDYTKEKALEVPANNQVIVEMQAQTEAARLSGTEGEEQPKQEGEKVILKSEEDAPRNEDGEKVVIKSEDDLPEVCNELNQEKKIGKIIHHSQKESIDNFSILQTSGSGLLSPLQTPGGTSRLLSPLCSSPAPARQVLLSPPAKENPIAKGDTMQQKPIKKKVDLTRFNMKQFVVNEMENKNTDTEKTVTETTRSEITESTPSLRTQGEVESENLLVSSLQLNKIITKNNEKGTLVNL